MKIVDKSKITEVQIPGDDISETKLHAWRN